MLDVSNAKILVVDDNAQNLSLMRNMLSSEYHNISTVQSGKAALEHVAHEMPDIILLDIMMPEMDGFEVASRLKHSVSDRDVPVIMVTALEDRQSRIRALDAGAEEVVSKPVDRHELMIRVKNMLRLHALSEQLKNSNQMLESIVSERTRDLQNSFKETLLTLQRAAEYRDDETGAHVRRISYYAKHLAQEMEKHDEFCELIFHASPMHDVGKIGIPDHILLKQGPLNEDEWVIMKSHATIGHNILKDHSSPHLKMGACIALCHHERWDGSGYPQGLKGEAIPFSARIMQICDVYDALRSERPYKKAFDHDKAFAIITEGDGRTEPRHFDPEVLAAFVQAAGYLAQVYDQYSDAHETGTSS
ncbi:response regulator [Ghiorsea bivora]|uniref:response regulator n=1 Tax=Ghiorsea bivora TaxID=1485545 RepID=UPI00056E8459|nr:HD domain-containing phosphohydrolase [Ghiorsea bivora]